MIAICEIFSIMIELPIKIPNHLHPKSLEDAQIEKHLKLIRIDILQQNQKIRNHEQAGARRLSGSVSARQKHC